MKNLSMLRVRRNVPRSGVAEKSGKPGMGVSGEHQRRMEILLEPYASHFRLPIGIKRKRVIATRSIARNTDRDRSTFIVSGREPL